MQPTQFNMLALAAVISLIAAGVVHSSYNSFNEEVVSGQRLFAALEGQSDKTSVIAIQKGQEALTLKKSADGKTWGMAERGGYPVEAQKVRRLVLSLVEAELIERKTRSEALYDQIDLGDPKKKGAVSRLVRLADARNKTIAEVVIGRERRAAFGAGKSGTYIRVPGDKQTWLAKLELNTSTDISDWVKPAFFVVDSDTLKSIVVKKGDSQIYKLTQSEKKKGEFKFADIPAGFKKKEKLNAGDLVNGVRTLEMTDVRKQTEADKKPDMTAEIVTHDGVTYRIGMKREDNKRWVTVAVVGTGKDQAGAKKLGEATKGWAFEIPEWRAKQSFKKREDLFDQVKAAVPKMSVPPTTQANKASGGSIAPSKAAVPVKPAAPATAAGATAAGATLAKTPPASTPSANTPPATTPAAEAAPDKPAAAQAAGANKVAPEPANAGGAVK